MWAHLMVEKLDKTKVAVKVNQTVSIVVAKSGGQLAGMLVLSLDMRQAFVWAEPMDVELALMKAVWMADMLVPY